MQQHHSFYFVKIVLSVSNLCPHPLSANFETFEAMGVNIPEQDRTGRNEKDKSSNRNIPFIFLKHKLQFFKNLQFVTTDYIYYKGS